VHPPAPVIDLTQTLNDGATILDERGRKRRPNKMDLANPAMNDFMTLMGIKRIDFLKNVGDPALIDDPLINTIELTRVRINENDENQLTR
jgi:hypothetical protein